MEVRIKISQEERDDALRCEQDLHAWAALAAIISEQLREQLEKTGLSISAVYGIMKGDTIPSVFLDVTKPRVTDGIEWEQSVLETRSYADIYHYFELEH